MSDNGIVLRAVCIILVFVLFAGACGLTVSGEITQPAMGDEAPGLTEIIGWAWDGIVFFFGMIAFQVSDIPYYISLIFLIITLSLTWVLVKWVRGTGGG